MLQNGDQEVIDFVNAGIASGNIDMMRGIAETVEDLSDEQIKALLFGGSLEVAKAMVEALKAGSTIFGEIAQTALSAEMVAAGAKIDVFNSDGTVAEPFQLIKISCDQDVIEDLDPALRYAKDNIARVILGLNLDGLDTAAVTINDIVFELEKVILSNQNAPAEVVTPYLTAESDVLRAKAFVHANTDNDEIVAVMTAEDEAGNNIDAFKLAMIADLNTDAMIQGNANIVEYLLGETQTAPVRYAMFKNYVTVVLNGGTTLPNVNVDDLVATFVK